MTDIEYASIAVKPARKARFMGYDLRFQKVRPRKTKVPMSDTHIIHWFAWIQLRYVSESIDKALTPAVARSWTVLNDVNTDRSSRQARRKLTK
jgi:hypothetical protein